MSIAVIRKNHSYSAIPDQLFSLDISPVAFKILAWALGRPDGWRFNIGHMLRQLGLTQRTWASARKQLVETGFFVQSRRRDDGGKIVWENAFTDEPLWKSTIPTFCTDGARIDGGSMHGARIDAKCRDITKDLNKVSKAAAAAGKSPKPSGTQHPLSLSPSSPPSSPAPESLLLIQNGQDQIKSKALREKFGLEAVESAAREVISEGNQPYPSNVAKKLGMFPSKNNAVRERPWFISNQRIEEKAKELGIVFGRDEQYHQFVNRVYQATGITKEQVRLARIDFP